jgi:nucleotide-binding universal stress UspA family protein
MFTQFRIKNILFATDFLQSSRLALDYAVAFAHHYKATIKMLHVVELSNAGIEAELTMARPCMTRLHAETRLEAFAAGVRRAAIDVETCVEDGIPCEVILRAATAQKADMLVLGVQGVHRGLAHLLLGSNTEKILLSAPCPTLTVGSHALAGVDLILHPREILYFSDFTPEATAAAPYALQLGRDFQVPVDVCQLVPEIAEGNASLRQKLAEEYCESMRRVIPEENSEWCSPAFHLDRGMAVEEIVNRAQTRLAALIVLGARKQSQLMRRLHTSFAYQLLAKASCPVLTIHNNSVDEMERYQSVKDMMSTPQIDNA